NTLSLEALKGTGPFSKSFVITNTGDEGSQLNWTATLYGYYWVNFSSFSNVQSISGSLYKNQSSTVTVYINAPYQVGVYIATVTISAANATNTPQEVFVRLTVKEPLPSLEINKSSFSFFNIYNTNQITPDADILTIKNVGEVNSILYWNIENNNQWLNISKYSDYLGPDYSEDITLTPINSEVNNLLPGVYSSTITIFSNDALNNPKIVNVSLIISSPPVISLDKSSFTFTTYSGSTTVPIGTLNITNTAENSVLNWSVSSNSSWLILTPQEGVAYFGETDQVNVSVNLINMYQGTYIATITVSGISALNSPQTIPVVVKILPPQPKLEISTNTLTFIATKGLGVIGGGKNIIVKNNGMDNSVLNWGYDENIPWVGCGYSGGLFINKGETASLYVSIFDISTFSVGVYLSTMTVYSVTTDEVEAIYIKLIVSSPPKVSLDKTTLEFTATAGGSNPQPQTFAITNTGPSDSILNWEASVFGNVSWLSFSPNNSMIGSGESSIVTVSVDITGLQVGVYEAEIVLDTNMVAEGEGEIIAPKVKIKLKILEPLNQPLQQEDKKEETKEEVVKPAEFHFTPTGGIRKKFEELKKKLEEGK
ncbi:MAG: hypothetical protein NZ839_04715, partial [Endomicrobia bacterium]|nr:hypothetical protein [Endomicrobiia bacterium]